MDKFIDNPWFIRIIALVLTLLLFISVNDLGEKRANTNPNGMEDQDTDTMTNVPLEIIYDSENLVVTGAPNTVDVTIEGQRRFIEATKRQRDFTVYIDLSNEEIGRHRVPVLYEDISDKLKVTIEPSVIEISLQEKVTEEFKVEAEFNRSILAEGFEAERPEVEPKTVTVTGAKDVVEKITYVKAIIDVSGLIDDTIKRQAPISVLDRELNKLNVMVEPSTVSVTIPVTNPRKNVPIRINKTGTPPEDIEIKTISTATPEVMVFGRTEVLEQIDELEISVDVTDIHEDTELEVPIQYPTGVNRITPDRIVVNITAEEKKYEKTFEDVLIEVDHLRNDLHAEILNPAEGAVSVTVIGDREDIENVTEDDVRVFYDVRNRSVGEYDLDLNVQVPENIEGELSVNKVKIRLTEKDD